MNRIRIGIDGYNLAMPSGTGVATYGFTLATLLSQRGHSVEGVFGIDARSDPRMREILFFESLGRQGRRITGREKRRIAWQIFWKALRPFLTLEGNDISLTGRVATAPLTERLPPFDRLTTSPMLFDIAHRHFGRYGRFARLHIVDPPPIMHWTYPVPIELVGSRNIYTLHDLVPLRLPYTSLEAKGFYRRLVASCIARAARICTVSEASRNDIVAEFGISPDRVVNTYQAAPLPRGFLDAPAEADAAAIEATLGLRDRGYFLFFGTIEPKKNVGRLLEAYLSLRTDTPLVIVGAGGWSSDDDLRLLAQPNMAETYHARTLAERVIRLEHLPRLLLLRLIRSARAVLFPSLYEGFGLPVLEAMQMGTPVLTSGSGSLLEVAGDAALIIEPLSVQDIAAGLRRLDEDAALRTQLAHAGPIQAARFSADKYLERLEHLYDGTIEGRF